MAANVLRSGRAVEVSVLIVRALVRMRAALADSAELGARMEELAREVERQGGKLATHDAAILRILDEIRRLTWPYPAGSEELQARLLYVAMTRATHDLVLTSCKASRFSERLKVLCA